MDKRALLIGIDTYPHLSQLDGCVNDVTLMRSILEERFGFPAANITLLDNERATRDAILRELDALVAATGRDDIVVVHYAGHGSQVRDREYDEPSGFDNTIMPYESQGWRGPFCDITDDEINLRLEEFAKKTANTTLVFDSCHSGSITRGAVAKSRGQPRDTRPVSELPPSPIPVSMQSKPAGPSGWSPVSDAYVLIAGCRDEETSYEYRPPGDDAEAHGALSYFLSSALAGAHSGTTYRDVFESVAARVNAANSAQHPQMEGRIDRELFGIRDLAPTRHVRVVHRQNDVVTLAAGVALGMTVGSQWAVHQAGTKTVGEATLLGDVEIVAARAVMSTARIVSEKSPGAITENTRAFEVEHSFGDLRLPVHVWSETGFEMEMANMRALVSASPLLRLSPNAAGAVQVVAIGARDSVGDEDIAPEAGASGTAFWAVLGETGKLWPPAKPLHATADVRRNLERIARYRQALSLENDDLNSTLRGKVEFAILRDRQGQWVEAVPDSAGGEVVLHEGEYIAFRITNNHTSPLFISILDFTLSAGVALLYPPLGAQDGVTAGTTFEFPANVTKRIRLDAEANAITDVETFKLIATTGPADFSFLTQQGVRSGDRRASRLAMLLKSATQGTRAANVGPEEIEEWTTVTRSFVFRPKRIQTSIRMPEGATLPAAPPRDGIRA